MGTGNLTAAFWNELSRVGGRDDDTCLHELRRLSLSDWNHQLRRLALLSLPAALAIAVWGKVGAVMP